MRLHWSLWKPSAPNRQLLCLYETPGGVTKHQLLITGNETKLHNFLNLRIHFESNLKLSGWNQIRSNCQILLTDLLHRRFLGWFSCVVGISAEKLLTHHRFKAYFYEWLRTFFASHIFIAVVVAPENFCHKHHKLTFWCGLQFWERLGHVCIHTEVSSGEHQNEYCKTPAHRAQFYPQNLCSGPSWMNQICAIFLKIK